MKEPVRRRGGLARRYHPLQQARRQRSGALEDGRHHIRERGPALRAVGSLLKPDRAPGVGDPPPSREPGLVLLQVRQCPLFRSHLFERIAGAERELSPHRDCGTKRPVQAVVFEQRQRVGPGRLRLPGACCLRMSHGAAPTRLSPVRRRWSRNVSGRSAASVASHIDRRPSCTAIGLRSTPYRHRCAMTRRNPARSASDEIGGRGRPLANQRQPRRRSRDIGTRPRGMRRCPSRGRQPAARESRQVRRRAPVARASGEPALPSGIAACRTSPWPSGASEAARRAGKVLGQREIQRAVRRRRQAAPRPGRRTKSARAPAPAARVPAGSSMPAAPHAPRRRPAPGRPRAARAPARTTGR